MASGYRIVRRAFKALGRNVLRSFLTTLGIVIGVAAVIAMVEIGQGSSRAVEQTIASMGANVLMVQPGEATSGGVSFGSGSVLTLTPEDARAIKRECYNVRAVAPAVKARTQVIHAGQNWVPQFMYGTTPAFLEVRNWPLDEGAPFTHQDVRSVSQVCLLGHTVVDNLFPRGTSPVGKYVMIMNVPFRVLGVLQRKGANVIGLDQDDIVLAPWTTIKYRVSGALLTATNQSTNPAASNPANDPTQQTVNTLANLYPDTQATLDLYPTPSPTELADTPQSVRFANVDFIMVQATSQAAIPSAMREITALLHERHHIRPGQPNDFNVRDMTEMSRALGRTSRLLAYLLLFVALISLGVGGVGIMNIMLVSVTERTKEIGLRMAVGARARDILQQFLAEAIVLCLLGGLLGIVVGRGVSVAVSDALGWPAEVSYLAMVVAVVVSAGVGILFGYYPAWKASKLDPIEALRYE